MGVRGSKLPFQEAELTALGFTRKPQRDVEETVVSQVPSSALRILVFQQLCVRCLHGRWLQHGCSSPPAAGPSCCGVFICAENVQAGAALGRMTEEADVGAGGRGSLLSYPLPISLPEDSLHFSLTTLTICVCCYIVLPPGGAGPSGPVLSESRMPLV